MIRSFFFAFLTLLFSVTLIVPSVNAHKVSGAGSVGTNIHIDPDDKPFAGQQTSISIEFKDKTGEFNSADCTCSIIVKRDNTVILSKGLFVNNKDSTISTAHIPILFPVKGLYTIIISGSPQKSSHFEPFSIEYEINVDRDVYSSPQKPVDNTDKKIIFMTVVMVVCLLGGIFFVKRKKRKKQ